MLVMSSDFLSGSRKWHDDGDSSGSALIFQDVWSNIRLNCRGHLAGAYEMTEIKSIALQLNRLHILSVSSHCSRAESELSLLCSECVDGRLAYWIVKLFMHLPAASQESISCVPNVLSLIWNFQTVFWNHVLVFRSGTMSCIPELWPLFWIYRLCSGAVSFVHLWILLWQFRPFLWRCRQLLWILCMCWNLCKCKGWYSGFLCYMRWHIGKRVHRVCVSSRVCVFWSSSWMQQVQRLDYM